jgi:hypothetical protein
LFLAQWVFGPDWIHSIVSSGEEREREREERVMRRGRREESEGGDK